MNIKLKIHVNPIVNALIFCLFVDMRYALQLNEVRTPVPGGGLDEEGLKQVWDEFERLYEKQFGAGAGYREAGMQVVTFRVEARAKITRPTLVKFPLQSADASGAVKEKRNIFLPGQKGFADVAVYDGRKLQAGNAVPGPAIIELPLTNVLIDEDQTGKLDEYLNIMIKGK